MVHTFSIFGRDQVQSLPEWTCSLSYFPASRVHFQWNRYTVITVFLEYMLAQWVSAQRNKISRFEYPQNTRYEFEFSMVLVPVRYSIVSVLQGGVQSRVLLRTKLLVQT